VYESADSLIVHRPATTVQADESPKNRLSAGNSGKWESPALIRLASQPTETYLNLSHRRARFAFVSLRPVVLNLGVQILALLLHFRAFLDPVNQIGTEQIELVIQSDKPAHQFVLHLAIH
jgi:hypothetical protein